MRAFVHYYRRPLDFVLWMFTVTAIVLFAELVSALWTFTGVMAGFLGGILAAMVLDARSAQD